MSKKTNETFLTAYMELDALCSKKFAIKNGGVTEYINRLHSTKRGLKRDEALSRLVRYRSIRNKLAHEAGALQNLSDIKTADVTWVKGFCRDLQNKRDPLSARMRKSRKKIEIIHNKWVKIFLPILGVAIIVAVAAVLISVLALK